MTAVAHADRRDLAGPVTVGALLGLTWAASLRGWMTHLAGTESQLHAGGASCAGSSGLPWCRPCLLALVHDAGRGARHPVTPPDNRKRSTMNSTKRHRRRTAAAPADTFAAADT